MAQHDIEIKIGKDGKVKVHVKGAKGKACLEYAQWLQSIIGNLEDQKLTSEYYEPEQVSRTKLKQELNNNG
ncbi:MAG: DUF2997 domain-containing protein [Sedimentisphaeraceae bacterium JB056]